MSNPNHVVTYHPNGRIHEDYYTIDGQKSGPYQGYFSDGTKYAEIMYREGKFHGRYLMWNYRGDKIVDCGYRQGELDGRCTRWSHRGDVVEEVDYVDGHRRASSADADDAGADANSGNSIPVDPPS